MADGVLLSKSAAEKTARYVLAAEAAERSGRPLPSPIGAPSPYTYWLCLVERLRPGGSACARLARWDEATGKYSCAECETGRVVDPTGKLSGAIGDCVLARPWPGAAYRWEALEVVPECEPCRGVTTCGQCTSTTTTPCAGTCGWVWRDDAGWTLAAHDCPGGCGCLEPDEDGEGDGELAVNPCRQTTTTSTTTSTTTTTTTGACSGDCHWTWDEATRSWIQTNACSEGCRCEQPTICGSSDGEVLRLNCTRLHQLPPCCGTTTTPAPTTTSVVGSCWAAWNGNQWVTQGACPDGSRCVCTDFPDPSACVSPFCLCVTDGGFDPLPSPAVCIGRCVWAWWDDGEHPGGWMLQSWGCGWSPGVVPAGATGCVCAPPSHDGEWCLDLAETACGASFPASWPTTTPSGGGGGGGGGRPGIDCRPTTTSTTAGCTASCVWEWDAANECWRQISSSCPSGCPCATPPRDGAVDGERVIQPCRNTTTTSSTTTTRPPTTTTTTPHCNGTCTWEYNGYYWLVVSYHCGTGNCVCESPPPLNTTTPPSGVCATVTGSRWTGPCRRNTTTTPPPGPTTTTPPPTTTTPATTTTTDPCAPGLGCHWMCVDTGQGHTLWVLVGGYCGLCGCQPPQTLCIPGFGGATGCNPPPGPTTTTPPPTTTTPATTTTTIQCWGADPCQFQCQELAYGIYGWAQIAACPGGCVCNFAPETWWWGQPCNPENQGVTLNGWCS